MSSATNAFPALSEYALLGRSGLRVSPICLGTMTFGTEWGWGSDEDTARAVFRRYTEAGGNFIDTADLYTNGKSEELLGKFIADAKNRDSLVLATKFTFTARLGDPNAGGNSRKHIIEAVNGSLRRLKTDYIDLYWLHCWDRFTPVEEVMYALDTLVRQGKVHYIGLSDVPAWYLARAQTIAELRGWERICALQLEYSLCERNIEHEHIPAALHLGMGVCPWSPLAGGFLSGKYNREQGVNSADGRLKTMAAGGTQIKRLNDRNWEILDALLAISKELGRSPAEVALNWITKRPGISSTIIGATRLEQLDANLGALGFNIPAELSARLDAASEPLLHHPYSFFRPEVQTRITGGASISAEQPWFRGA